MKFNIFMSLERKEFLNKAQKAWAVKKRNWQNYVKIKIICSGKDTIHKYRKQDTG